MANSRSHVFCHNDLNRRNILFQPNGSVAIIDNDHCSVGNGLYDLATLAVTYNMDHEQEHFLLSEYSSHPKAVIDGSIRDFKRYVCLTYAFMVLSFIEEYGHINPCAQVTQINPSEFHTLSRQLRPDQRLYILSHAYLDLAESYSCHEPARPAMVKAAPTATVLNRDVPRL